MIFSRIFSPAHASADPEKRIQAIAKLSADKAGERSTLHELAFNDSSSAVSLAALEKLNSFPLWLKVAQTAKDAKVRRRAVARVEEAIIHGQSDEISPHEKQEYLLRQAPVELVKKALESDANASISDEDIVALLDKVGRSDYTQKYFAKHASASVQLALICNCSSLSLLNRFAKKCRSDAVSAALQEKITRLKEQEERPKALEQAYTLVLSKLQAITERQDYEDVVSRLQDSVNELEILDKDFSVLPDDIATVIREKQVRLMEKAQQHQARLQVQWQANAQQRDAERKWDALKTVVRQAEEKVNWLFTERLCEATLADVESVNASVRDLEAELENITVVKDKKALAQYRQVVSTLIQQIDAFSAQQQLALRLVSTLENTEQLLQDSENGELNENEWQDAALKWSEHKQLLFGLPKDWKHRWSVIERTQKQKQTQIKLANEQALKACRRLLSMVSNLISNGRFRGAMARFGELDAIFNELTPQGQAQLSRRYEQIKADIEKLEGWQSYLAAPRKPALLEEAKSLAASAADDIPARVNAIKLLRQQWQSLSVNQNKGEIDIAFDEALEQAFLPCRVFFAEQEQQREAALAVRESLINDVSAVNIENEDLSALAKQLDKFKQRWRDAGAVEKDKYQVVKQRWDNAISPLNQAVNGWHNENRRQKQAIVNEAKALLSDEDLNASASKAQALQQQWKDIGHAGKRYETKLWQVFKETNDKIFARVKAQRQSEQQHQSLVVDEILEEIKGISRTVKQQPEAVDAALVPVLEKARALDSKKQSVIHQRIDKLRRNVQNQLQEAELDDRRSGIQALASVIALWRDTPSLDVATTDEWQTLPKLWKAAISDGAQLPQTRSWYAHVLEIMLGIDAPAERVAERRDVQLALMTAKLEKGDDFTFAEAVAYWLSFGEPSDSESERMLRILTQVQDNATLLKGVM